MILNQIFAGFEALEDDRKGNRKTNAFHACTSGGQHTGNYEIAFRALSA